MLFKIKMLTAIFVLMLGACSKEKACKNSNIGIINKIKEVENKYCLSGNIEILHFNNWNSYADEYCDNKANNKNKTNCYKSMKKYISKNIVPFSLVKETPFIFIYTWTPMNCPPGHACSNDSGKILLLDAETYEVIQTPASERYKKNCAQ